MMKTTSRLQNEPNNDESNKLSLSKRVSVRFVSRAFDYLRHGPRPANGSQWIWAPSSSSSDNYVTLIQEPVPNHQSLGAQGEEDDYVLVTAGPNQGTSPVVNSRAFGLLGLSGFSGTSFSSDQRSSPPTPTSGAEVGEEGGSPRQLRNGTIRLDVRLEELSLGESLGSGAFGVVRRGEWQGKPVAVKLPHKCDHMDAEKKERLRQELMESLRQEMVMLARVGEHPNVVQCYGGSIVPARLEDLFIINELKTGGDLWNLMHRGSGNNTRQPLPVGRTLEIMVDIVEGLDHLHSLDPMIVHRDLKPQNILLGEDGRASIADLGLSRSQYCSHVKTKNGQTGTWAYMAPELGALQPNVTEKVDIYAVGVIFWECLSGERPWKESLCPDAIPFQVNRGHRLEFPEKVFAVNPLMSEIRSLISRCWLQEPKERPNCKTLLRELSVLRANVLPEMH